MNLEEIGTRPLCPDPWTRAPRVSRDGSIALERLYFAPPALQGAMVALICRDTTGLVLDSAQRLSHFPASPLVTLSWFQDMDVGLVTSGARPSAWRPFGSPVMISGSQSHPIVSWAPTTGRGCMACFTADMAQALFGLEPASVQDRFLPARQVLGAKWTSLWEALLRAKDDAATMSALHTHLEKPWREMQGRGSPVSSLRRVGRHWVDRLAWQAQQWRRTQSPRQVERRVKSFSGRSLRQWQSLVRTEEAFFAARDRYEAGQSVEWASLAQDEGFADQSHLSRTAKRITGFAPREFSQRYMEDESFWLYRLWV